MRVPFEAALHLGLPALSPCAMFPPLACLRYSACTQFLTRPPPPQPVPYFVVLTVLQVYNYQATTTCSALYHKEKASGAKAAVPSANKTARGHTHRLPSVEVCLCGFCCVVCLSLAFLLFFSPLFCEQSTTNRSRPALIDAVGAYIADDTLLPRSIVRNLSCHVAQN